MFFVFMGMLMMALSGSSLGTGTNEHHNRQEHDTLCNLLGAAATLYKSGRAGEKLKKALTRAIFGDESGGNLNTLLAGLPETHHNPGNRQNWCGTCTNSDGSHYPGGSIPHDLICMCTVGSGGHPFLKSYDGTPTLCGKKAKELGCEGQREGRGCHSNNTHWWTSSTTNHDVNEQTKLHLEATWNSVVKPCLQGGHNGRARETLLEKLKVGHQQSPSWGGGHQSCGGSSWDVCVNYATTCHDNPRSPQWWKTLYEALTAPEDTRAKGNSKKSPRKRTRRNTGDSPAPVEPEEDGEEDEPEPTGFQSTSTNNRPPRLLSNQQSGTLLTKPLLCLLSAVLLI